METPLTSPRISTCWNWHLPLSVGLPGFHRASPSTPLDVAAMWCGIYRNMQRHQPVSVLSPLARRNQQRQQPVAGLKPLTYTPVRHVAGRAWDAGTLRLRRRMDERTSEMVTDAEPPEAEAAPRRPRPSARRAAA